GARAFDVGNPGAPLVSGQSVVVTGRILAPPSRHAAPLRITVLGRTAAHPRVRPVQLVALVNHEVDAERVYVHATVSAVVRHGDSADLQLEDGAVRARARIDVIGDPGYPDLTGARVRLGGTGL